MKLRKGNVLHLSVSHSVHRGVSASVHARISPQVDTPLADTPPADTPLADPPPQRMATAVDGTHPTGMLSCQFTSLLPSLEPPSSRDPTLVYSGFSQMHEIGIISINANFVFTFFHLKIDASKYKRFILKVKEFLGSVHLI